MRYVEPGRDQHVIERMRWLTVLLPAASLLALLVLTVEVLTPSLPRLPALLLAFSFSTLGIVAFSRAVFAVIERLQEQLRHQNEELHQRTGQLRAVHEAGLHVTANLSLSSVLQNVVDSARELVNAKYGALAVVDHGQIREFISSGLSVEEEAKIDRPPEGKGLLGHVLESGQPYRSADIAADPYAAGFPPGHPPMTTFLGVPIVSGGRAIGDLYLTEKRDGEFGAADEEAVQTLALTAAIAIENARLYQDAQDVAVLRERERIGMDLHDGAIQSLYAVGLRLDGCIERLETEPQVVQAEIDASIEDLNAVIRNIRSYIFDLRPQEIEGRDLEEALAELLRDLAVNTLITTDLRLATDDGVQGRPSAALTAEEKRQLYHIAHEALTNVRKHAHARKVRGELSLERGAFSMRIVDDGVGLSDYAAANAAGNGLVNMRERARSLGGELRIEPGEAGGTAISVVFPVNMKVS